MSRLSQALHQLLQTRRVAALGTLNSDGTPLVSMVPYAIDAQTASLVIHVSALAAHTANLQRTPSVSLLVMQGESPGKPVHALARVTVQGGAALPVPGSADWLSARAAYLTRFPDAQPMMELGDFQLVAIHPDGARQVAGFGAARSVDAQDLARILTLAPDANPAH